MSFINKQFTTKKTSQGTFRLLKLVYTYVFIFKIVKDSLQLLTLDNHKTKLTINVKDNLQITIQAYQI